MLCFLLGHKFGKVENEHQCCLRCGLAQKIHPCNNGHVWGETGRNNLIHTNVFGRQTYIGAIVYLKCKNCGEVTSKNLTI